MTSRVSNAGRRRLQRLVDRLAAKRRIPHAVLAVQSLDGSLSWAGAAGDASPDGTPMTVDTPFFIASIDKTFVATVVLQLHERDALSIDDPVVKYLDSDQIDGLHRQRGIDYTPRITIRHLLGHTSGLPDYLEDYPKKGPSLVVRLFEGEDRDFSREEMLRVVIEELEPHFPPQPVDAARQKARYSDTNYQLLAAIVEAVCAQPLHRVISERVFRPLDLKRTWYAGLSEPSEPTIPPATLWEGDRPLDRPTFFRSIHSVYSTTEDLITFMRALMCGELFDAEGTLGLMLGRWNRFGVPRDRGALRAPGWPIEYALGVKRFRLPRLFTPLSPVSPVIGHTGSTGTWLFHCPDLKVTVAGAVDQVTAGAVPFRLVPRVLRILARELEA